MPHEGGAQGSRQAAMSELQGALSDRGWDPRDADRGRKARVRNALGGALVVAPGFGGGGGLGVPGIGRYLGAGGRGSPVRIAARGGENHADDPPPQVEHSG